MDKGVGALKSVAVTHLRAVIPVESIGKPKFSCFEGARV